MKNGDEIHELTYDLIKRAVRGEANAVEEILRIYEPYHNSLVSKEYVGEDGKIYKVVDEEKYASRPLPGMRRPDDGRGDRYQCTVLYPGKGPVS